MSLPNIVHYGPLFHVHRRDRSFCTLFLRTDKDAMSRARALLSNTHGNPFVKHTDLTRYINHGNHVLVNRLNIGLSDQGVEPLSPDELASKYILVQSYTTTCA